MAVKKNNLKTKQINLKVTEDEKEYIENKAFTFDMSVSELILYCVKNYKRNED